MESVYYPMPQTASDIAPLLNDLRDALQDLYGSRLQSVVLYGSYARGEATEDSDIDVMVVLEGEVDVWQELSHMADAALEQELKYNEMITLLPISIERFQEASAPLLVNVRQEGRQL